VTPRLAAASRKLAGRLASGAGRRAGTPAHGRTRPVASAPETLLSCGDSAGQQAGDLSARPVNGVESAAWLGDTNAYDTLPAWRSRDGRRYLVWKTYLAVAPGARPYRTITVTSPGSARLFYASPARWGAVSGAPVTPRPPRAVRLASCGRQYAGFTGAILIVHPACVTLTITGPGRTPRTVTVPILVRRCGSG
jgi:hypothetical protein